MYRINNSSKLLQFPAQFHVPFHAPFPVYSIRKQYNNIPDGVDIEIKKNTGSTKLNSEIIAYLKNNTETLQYIYNIILDELCSMKNEANNSTNNDTRIKNIYERLIQHPKTKDFNKDFCLTNVTDKSGNDCADPMYSITNLKIPVEAMLTASNFITKACKVKKINNNGHSLRKINFDIKGGANKKCYACERCKSCIEGQICKGNRVCENCIRGKICDRSKNCENCVEGKRNVKCENCDDNDSEIYQYINLKKILADNLVPIEKSELICFQIDNKYICTSIKSNSQNNKQCTFCERWVQERNMFRNIIKDLIYKKTGGNIFEIMSSSSNMLPAAIFEQQEYHNFYTAIEEYKQSRRIR